MTALSACGNDEAAELSADDSAMDASEAIAGGEFEGDVEAGGPDADASVQDLSTAPQTGGAASAGLPVSLNDRDFITTVGLTMSTSDVRRTTEDIRRVTAAAGGAVFSSNVFLDDDRDDGSVPGGGQIVVKVPPGDLDRLIADLDGVGLVTQLSQDARDVTDQLIDLEIRIRQAEAGIVRVESLLADAVELDDVFAIENELNRRQVDLERLRAQERNTDDLVALATLTIQVEYRSPARLDEAVAPDSGITDAFADGWAAFVGALFALGYVLAITAPFLVSGLLVSMVALLVGRRWHRSAAERRERDRRAADRPGDLLAPPATARRVAAPSGEPPSTAGSTPAPDAAQRVGDRPDADTIVDG